jgi:threonine/homoserine/homoserine lactone efflux protein
MPDASTWLGFLAAVLAMQIIPGPDTVLVLTRGVAEGRKIALASVLGMTVLAAFVQLPVLAFGLDALRSTAPVVFDALRWAGAAYLVWLGIRLLVQSDAVGPFVDDVGRRRSMWSAAWEGMTCTLLNPNPMLFMLALLPQFVDLGRGSVANQLLMLGVVQKLTGLFILGATALVAGTAGDWIARRPRIFSWLRRAAGVLMCGLGLRLIFNR